MGVAQRVFRPNVLRGVVLYATLTAIATCALFPILWAVSGSLKTAGEVTMPTLFPAHPQWSNYRDVFAVMPFWRMFFNSVLYAGCVSIGQVFFCSLAGYAFARLRFRGRDTLFVLYLGTLMVPLTVTVIPQLKCSGSNWFTARGELVEIDFMMAATATEETVTSVRPSRLLWRPGRPLFNAVGLSTNMRLASLPRHVLSSIACIASVPSWGQLPGIARTLCRYHEFAGSQSSSSFLQEFNNGVFSSPVRLATARLRCNEERRLDSTRVGIPRLLRPKPGAILQRPERRSMPHYFALLSIVFMTSFVLLFDSMHLTRSNLRFTRNCLMRRSGHRPAAEHSLRLPGKLT